MRYFWTADLKSKQYKDCLSLRKEVFIKELYSDETVEIHDEEKCEFLIIYENDMCVATGRIKIENDIVKIQRVAVKKEFRKKGLGKVLIKEIERRCLEKKFLETQVCASINAINFYKSLGYEEYGEIFDRCGINHIMMNKKL